MRSPSKLKNAFMAMSFAMVELWGVGGVRRVSLLDELDVPGAIGARLWSPLFFSKNASKRLSQWGSLVSSAGAADDVPNATEKSPTGGRKSAPVLRSEMSKIPGTFVPLSKA